MGVGLQKGRLFTREDAAAANHILYAFPNNQTPEPVIVNESFVRRFFTDEDPIGKKLLYGPKKYPYEIIGVVGDMHRQGLEREPIAEYFVALRSNTADIVVRTASDPTLFNANIREIVRSVDGKAIVSSVTTVESQMGELSAQRKFQTWLLGLFAGIALVLAIVGIYGIMHYAVAERTHEIGIRIALGARSFHVTRLVVGQGLKLNVDWDRNWIHGSVMVDRLDVTFPFWGERPRPPGRSL
jgi:hypothetical protein